MRSAAVCIAFVLTCTSGSLVAGIRYIDPLGSNGDIGDKRLDLTEPSCDELRAMWRYTKRQSRAAKTTNGYGMYMGDPYNPNIWQRAELPDRPKYSKGRGRHGGRPRSRAAGGLPIYGKMVHKAPAGSTWRSGMRGPSRIKAIEEYYGTVNTGPYSPNNRLGTSFRVGGGLSPPKTQVPQAGSFEALKNLIKAERALELQKQHIEEMEAKAAFKGRDRLSEEQEPNRQQSRKQFSNPFLEMMTPKVDYDSRRYSSNHQAWSRSDFPLSREYMSP